jgi:hypothetical protein
MIYLIALLLILIYLFFREGIRGIIILSIGIILMLLVESGVLNVLVGLFVFAAYIFFENRYIKLRKKRNRD